MPSNSEFIPKEMPPYANKTKVEHEVDRRFGHLHLSRTPEFLPRSKGGQSAVLNVKTLDQHWHGCSSSDYYKHVKVICTK